MPVLHARSTCCRLPTPALNPTPDPTPPTSTVLASLVPRAHLVPAVRPEDMSQDPAVVQAYLDDPLIPKGNVKAQTGNECLKVGGVRECDGGGGARRGGRWVLMVVRMRMLLGGEGSGEGRNRGGG